MENETCETCGGTIVHRTRPPLDVRVVAYYLYFGGFLALTLSLLLIIGVAKPADNESRRVLLGTMVLDSGSTQAVYTLCIGGCTLFCAWGLMRRVKFAWWFALVYQIYFVIDEIVVFPPYSIYRVISMALVMALIAWLWFRRKLYSVHLGSKGTGT